MRPMGHSALVMRLYGYLGEHTARARRGHGVQAGKWASKERREKKKLVYMDMIGTTQHSSLTRPTILAALLLSI